MQRDSHLQIYLLTHLKNVKFQKIIEILDKFSYLDIFDFEFTFHILFCYINKEKLPRII